MLDPALLFDEQRLRHVNASIWVSAPRISSKGNLITRHLQILFLDAHLCAFSLPNHNDVNPSVMPILQKT